MSLVSEQTLHGKVDCRHGINEEALFAACVDANWSNASASDLVDGIAKAINSASDYLGLVEYRDVGPKWHWNISKMSKGRNTVIEILQQSGLSTRLDTMKIQSISHVIQSFSKCKSTEISEWVKTKFLELLTQVSDCDTEGSFRERKDAGLSLIFAFGTLLLLDQLGVHQLSYSPVPIASLEAPYAKLLVSMMVNMNDTEILAKSTPLGVGLLRVCSNKTSADPGHSLFSNRMLLRGVGHGESLRMHAAQQVSISIAETLQDEATTPSFTKRFASDLWMNDTIVHMETNLDDTTGESLAFAISLLLDNGAIDAFVTPIVMKKGRPAHTLHCLCKDETKDGSAKVKKLLELIFRHTTTLGIRIYDDMPRAKLCRSTVTVQTPYVDTSRGGKWT